MVTHSGVGALSLCSSAHWISRSVSRALLHPTVSNCADMESRSDSKRRRTGVMKCLFCDSPIYNVCELCSRSTINSGNAARCPRSNQRTALTKIAKEKKPQGAVGNSESTFRSMLREGNKMLGNVTRNVASARDHLFGIEEEDENIDQLVEEFKKAQLEGRK